MVDLGLVRLPIPRRGLRIEPLFQEARVVVLADSHPLAATHAAPLDVAALADHELLQSPDAVPEWRDARLRRGLPVCGSPRIVEGFSRRLPGRGPRCSRS